MGLGESGLVFEECGVGAERSPGSGDGGAEADVGRTLLSAALNFERPVSSSQTSMVNVSSVPAFPRSLHYPTQANTGLRWDTPPLFVPICDSISVTMTGISGS